MIFHLGTHMPNWLADSPHPLFVSVNRLMRRESLPKARARWGLDSAGFTQLSMHGKWTIAPIVYAGEAERYQKEIGKLRFASIQDYMCEPWILKKTGLTVAEHQRRTIDSYHRLTDLAPGVPWLPVIQGYTLADYLRHLDAYDRAGVDLTRFDFVGLGSVCRRQHTDEIAEIVTRISGLGIKVHGFGVKIKGLEKVGHLLASADSMAWSFDARRKPPLRGCTHSNCANCYRFAMQWRARIVGLV